MDVKPIERHEPPAYPTRREMLAGAASFALVGLTGTFLFAKSEEGKIAVAPVFKHGEGRGATGCAVVSPPVFLSEEEGMQILREELAKAGIQLKPGAAIKGVRIPHRVLVDKNEGTNKKTSREVPVASKRYAEPLKPTGIDSAKKIAVEFISEKRYFDQGGTRESYDLDELEDPNKKTNASEGAGGFRSSTAQGYDFADTADFVATQAKKQGADQLFLGVFYDPLASVPFHWKKGDEIDSKKRQKQETDESKKLLRQQAQDFVAWLKKEKAIK